MTPRPSGDEASSALAAVLQDQVDRKRREKEAPPPKEKGRWAQKILIPLAVVTVWLFVAPPAFLLPPPAPTSTFDDVRNGLHMDIFIAARQVAAYRDTNGRLPAELADVLPEAETRQDLSYLPGQGGHFEVTGRRAGQVVVYSSTLPLSMFVARARAAIREGSGS